MNGQAGLLETDPFIRYLIPEIIVVNLNNSYHNYGVDCSNFNTGFFENSSFG